MKFEIEISDAAFNLLKSIEKGYAEYRDPEYSSLDEFKNSEEYKDGTRTIEWFESRNNGGTLYLIYELYGYGLVDQDFDAWHRSYVITDFGKSIIGQKEEFIFASNNEKILVGENYYIVDEYGVISTTFLSEVIQLKSSNRYFKDENSASEFVHKNTFISDDGEKYFHGIYMEKKPIYCVDPNFKGVDLHDGYYPGMSDHYLKFFSSKESAVEFLEKNKPCLSFNDVIHFISDQVKDEELLSIIRQKIKNNG